MVLRPVLHPRDAPARLRCLGVRPLTVPRARGWPHLVLQKLVSPLPWRQLPRERPLRSRACVRRPGQMLSLWQPRLVLAGQRRWRNRTG